MRVPIGSFDPNEVSNLVFDEASFLDIRPANVNADGEFIFRVSGYEDFPALYVRRVSSRSKANRRSTC